MPLAKGYLIGGTLIQLGKSPLGGLAVEVGQIQSRMVHGLHHQVEGDLTAARQEIGQGQGVDGAHGGHGVALDAGDLDKPTDGVAGKTQVMLQRHLGGVLDLVDAHFEQLTEGGGGHGAGGAHLGLTAAFCAADRCVGGHQITHKPRYGQGADDVAVGKSVLVLHILEDGGKDAAGAAGGSGDDDAVIGVLLTDGEGVGADQAVLAGLGGLVDVALVVELLRFSLHLQPAGEDARVGQTLADGGGHGVPDVQEERGKIGVLMLENVIRQADAAGLADLCDLGKALLGVDLGGQGEAAFLAVHADLTAAYRQKAHTPDFDIPCIPDEIQGIGMGEGIGYLVVGVEHDLGGDGEEGVGDGAVGAVTLARLGQGAVEDDLKPVGSGVSVLKGAGGKGGTHGVGGGGAHAGLIYGADGFHGMKPSFRCEFALNSSIPQNAGKIK